VRTIYVAHPFGKNIKNFHRYLAICAWVSDQGYVVASWAGHVLTHALGLTNQDENYYLQRSKYLILRADELWIAGDPTTSPGMMVEIAFAKAVNIKIVPIPEAIADHEWLPTGYNIEHTLVVRP
jgi:hypothetical protein